MNNKEIKINAVFPDFISETEKEIVIDLFNNLREIFSGKTYAQSCMAIGLCIVYSCQKKNVESDDQIDFINDFVKIQRWGCLDIDEDEQCK